MNDNLDLNEFIKSNGEDILFSCLPEFLKSTEATFNVLLKLLINKSSSYEYKKITPLVHRITSNCMVLFDSNSMFMKIIKNFKLKSSIEISKINEKLTQEFIQTLKNKLINIQNSKFIKK